MKNIQVRALSGAVYVAVIVAAILFGPWSFFALTAVFVIVGLYEYINLTAATLTERPAMAMNIADYVAGLAIWAIPVGIYWSEPRLIGGSIAMLLLWVLVRMTQTVMSQSPSALRMLSRSVLGTMYIGLPMMLVNYIYLLSGAVDGPRMLMITFICIWINDTGAYLVGSQIGRRKLCERLSPKKSWEGFWGGLGLVVVALIVYALCTGQSSAGNIVIYALYGAVVSVLSTVGDLFESLLKRTAGVKDSGSFIPGHGGILDRIDSFLFAQYAILLFIACMMMV